MSWFQSTHPQGVRRVAIKYKLTPLEFQSTHPQGVRPLVCFPHKIIKAFQSTHPQGVRRQITRPVAFRQTVSIHAPAGGATQWGN